MARIGKLALSGLGLAAFGWAFAGLKPIPQTLLIALPLVALLTEFSAAHRAKPSMFLITASIAAAMGYLVAGSTLVTLVAQSFSPDRERSMPVATLLIGGMLGLALLALTVGWLLRPIADVERSRRLALAAIFGTACISLALDRIVFN